MFLSALKSRIATARSQGLRATGRFMSSTRDNSEIPNNQEQPSTDSTQLSQESKMQRVDRVITPILQKQQETQPTRGPNSVLENSNYTRHFFSKQTYQPRDLNEMYTLRTGENKDVAKNTDPFLKLGLNPLKEYKNTTILSSFVTEMGKIKPRYKSGLTAKSQRRVAQAIKRARAFGLMPVTNKAYSMYKYKTLGRGSK